MADASISSAWEAKCGHWTSIHLAVSLSLDLRMERSVYGLSLRVHGCTAMLAMEASPQLHGINLATQLLLCPELN